MTFQKLASSALALSLLGCGGDVVNPPPPPPTAIASVAIVEGDQSFNALGSELPLTTTVLDTDGNQVTNPTLTWAVLKSGVVSVTQAGRVRSLANGTDSVRVTAGDATGFIKVTVQQQASEISISTTSLALDYSGASSTIQATVVDANGTAVEGVSASFSSSDEAVAIVSESGTVTALEPGTARIDASSGGFAESAVVTVAFRGPHGGAIVGGGIICTGGMARDFPCDRMDIVSYLPISALGGNPNVPGAPITLTDMWGWTDSTTGKDWALVQRIDGMAFVDVTDPSTPRYVGYLRLPAGTNPAPWRDVKVFKNHAFVIGDGAGNYGMQIFDLTQLRNAPAVPTVFTETARYSGVVSSHNIFINEASGFAYIVGARNGGMECGSGLHMVDIQNPTAPVFAGCFADPLTGLNGTGYTHDAQCIIYDGPDPDYSGREICFGLNETALSIADVTDKSSPVALSRASYPGVTYAHQGWLTEDRRYLFSNDELDELGDSTQTTMTTTMIWDVVDLDDPILVKQYVGPTPAIDHNAYIKGNLLYQSNYQYGIRVLDITDPENPTERAFFDTAPNQSDTPGFGGSWTSYPFFDSDVVLVTSSLEGLFILRLTN